MGNYSSVADQARWSRVGNDHSSLAAALKIYSVSAGRPPSTDQGLDALVNEPRTEPKPRRWHRVMERVPWDPWQSPYRYAQLPSTSKWRFELRSAGKDMVFGSSDDIVTMYEWGEATAELKEVIGEPRPSY
ncbi:type II secretion system protein GspG [Luteolibacter flavescens]|uniref:Type II secretion system protein GspG n=2 Tax=Luteolibacter flavescens TaxID=1859460 RepID=A0ABT3FVE7_9BACT|nr:type II secretion system protein GspG [Luteolibacter flavescens]